MSEAKFDLAKSKGGEIMRERQPVRQAIIPGLRKLNEVELAMDNQRAERERLDELREWKATHRSEIRYMGQY